MMGTSELSSPLKKDKMRLKISHLQVVLSLLRFLKVLEQRNPIIVHLLLLSNFSGTGTNLVNHHQVFSFIKPLSAFFFTGFLISAIDNRYISSFLLFFRSFS